MAHQYEGQTEAEWEDTQPPPEPQFEVFWFDDRTGSERSACFYTQEAADKFMRSKPCYAMAH